MLLAPTAVDEVAVGFPDVVDELVAEGEAGDVGEVEGQTVIFPALSKVYLHAVRLKHYTNMEPGAECQMLCQK